MTRRRRREAETVINQTSLAAVKLYDKGKGSGSRAVVARLSSGRVSRSAPVAFRPPRKPI
jgi:hypothetical protein